MTSAVARVAAPSTTSCVPSIPGGRTAGSAARAPHTIAAPATLKAATATTRFVSSTGRRSGRWAANTHVDSLMPRLATRAVTIAVTVMNATCPRSVGPSARARSSTATK